MTMVMIPRFRQPLNHKLESMRRGMTRQRPTLMSFAFWSVYGLTALLALWGGVSGGFTVEWMIHATNILLIGVLWFTLRWEPDGGIRTLAPSGVFIAASFGLGITGSFGEHALLPVIGFANLAFVASLRTTITVVAVLAASLGVSSFTVFGNTLESSIRLAFTVLATAVFVVSLGLAIRRALEREHEAMALSERIRELTLAEERARMSREIHDSVGHHLTVVTMNLENAQLLKEDDPATAWHQVDDAKTTARAALADTRRWVRSLNPVSLRQGITQSSLHAFAASLAGAGVRLDIKVTGQLRPLMDDVQLVLYRAIQEGVTNAIRHAGAPHVAVELHYEQDEMRLVIRNSGTALTPGQDGFGLASLRERVAEKGGTLDFTIRNEPEFQAMLAVTVREARQEQA